MSTEKLSIYFTKIAQISTQNLSIYFTKKCTDQLFFVNLQNGTETDFPQCSLMSVQHGLPPSLNQSPTRSSSLNTETPSEQSSFGTIANEIKCLWWEGNRFITDEIKCLRRESNWVIADLDRERERWGRERERERKLRLSPGLFSYFPKMKIGKKVRKTHYNFVVFCKTFSLQTNGALLSKLLLPFSSRDTLWFLLVDVFLNITNRGISPPTYNFLSIIVNTLVLQIFLSKRSLIVQSGREGAGGGHEKTREWNAALC